MSVSIRLSTIRRKFICKVCEVVFCIIIFPVIYLLYITRGNITVNKSSVDQTFSEPVDRLHFQYIPDCKCSRKWMWPPPLGSGLKTDSIFNSTCSDEGTHFNDSQNVLTFTLFLPDGDKRTRYKKKWLYANGIRRNLESMREFFPGFTMRIYTNLSLSLNPRFCDFVCANSDVFWCDISHSPRWGNVSDTFHFNWRLLVLGDPTVDIFLVRNLGPTISDRDSSVVIDWLMLQDQKAIYVTRDSPLHDQPVLPGLWGGSNSLLGYDEAISIQEAVIAESKDITRQENWEQNVLDKIIFYPRRDDIVAYDSYYCKKSKEFTMVKPFPVERVIHKKVLTDNMEFPKITPTFPECPVECRPKHGKHWKFC